MWFKHNKSKSSTIEEVWWTSLLYYNTLREDGFVEHHQLSDISYKFNVLYTIDISI